jgi:hypothetical protein
MDADVLACLAGVAASAVTLAVAVAVGDESLFADERV